ncbi:chemotaxis protein CheX [Puniceicoccaceae bacterium K14]|nr:chemotaxis protein CheX [Puniceicoccaceae bacterium K14]
MTTIQINPERFDSLAKEAITHVFDFMISEKATYAKSSLLKGPGDLGSDMLPRLKEMADGYFTITVGFVGDAHGNIHLQLSRTLAERFAVKLLDVPSLEWIGEDSNEVLKDALGELGNSLVGLVKGGMTKWHPNLMLTTPKVVANGRGKVNVDRLRFRKQYAFALMKSPILVDLCYE